MKKPVIIATVLVLCIVENEILSLIVLSAFAVRAAYRLLCLGAKLEEGNAWRE